MDNKAKQFLDIAFKAYNRGHDDIAGDLAIAAFESEDAEQLFAEVGDEQSELSVEQINAFTDLAADISAAGHEDIAAELIDFVTDAVEAKAGIESDPDSTEADAEPTEAEIDAELAQILAEGEEESESGKHKEEPEEGEPEGDGAEGCESGTDEILDTTSIRKLKNIANKVSASGYKDQGSKIMAAVAADRKSVV